MERKKASDFPPEVLKLFDGYVHGGISRREFLDRAARYAVGGFSAAAMLEALSPNFAWGQQVKPDDKRISVEYVAYLAPKGSGRMRGYLARPAGARGKLSAVVVIHENRGLSPYIEDVARRLAAAGYAALAPDALAPLGGYPLGNEDQAREMWARLDQAKVIEDLVAAVDYVRLHPDANGKVGAIGFCFGGGVVNTIATRYPDLAAAVPYYGAQPPQAEAAKIRSPMLLHYAGSDTRLNAGWPAFEATLKAHHVKYEMHTYAGTQHGFHNDTTPRYDEAAAKLSWERTLAFFKTHLG